MEKTSAIFFHLYPEGPDYFSSMYLNILFVKDKEGKVSKAWCRLRGEYFWVEKINLAPTPKGD